MPSSLNASDYDSGSGIENMSDHADKINQEKAEQAQQQVNDSKVGGGKKKSRRKSRGKKGKKRSSKKSRGKKRRRRKVQRGGSAEEVQELDVASGSDDDQVALQKSISENMAQSEHNAKNDSDIGTMKGGRKRRRGKTVKVDKKKKKGKKSKKKLNKFFQLMLDAKKNNLPSFKYKGKTYKGKKHKRLGMIYKKA